MGPAQTQTQHNELARDSLVEALQQALDCRVSWDAKVEQLLPLNTSSGSVLTPDWQEALLLVGVRAVVDTLLSLIISSRSSAAAKLTAADTLSVICTDPQCMLLISPGNLVDRVIRAAVYQGHDDTRTAAARCLWQLACHPEYSPEVGHICLLHAK
jgi:hypothetical protein